MMEEIYIHGIILTINYDNKSVQPVGIFGLNDKAIVCGMSPTVKESILQLFDEEFDVEEMFIRFVDEYRSLYEFL